MNTDKFPKS